MKMNSWRFAWSWTIGATLLLGACAGHRAPSAPPTSPPATPAPDLPPDGSRVCVPGDTCGCSHRPPGSAWIRLPDCSTGSAPDAVNCDGLPGDKLISRPTTFGDQVNSVMSQMTGCSIGSRCLLNVSAQAWYRGVIDGLRARGICAGQHEPGSTDEIAVSSSPIGTREAYHVFAGYQNAGEIPPGETQRTVVWSPGAARDAYLAPGGSSPPPPPPAPTPAPGATCPFAPCPLREWTAETLPPGWGQNELGQPAYFINSHPYPGGKVDCTPRVKRQDAFCASIGYDHPVVSECPVRPDGHPERAAIETWLLYGGTVMDAKPGSGATCQKVEGNQLQFYANGGACRLCNATKSACSDWW